MPGPVNQLVPFRRNDNVKQIWESPNSFATTLVTLLADAYGYECFTWSPATIRMEIEDDFNVRLPLLNFDRLMAAVYHLTTDGFYVSLPDFNDICCAFSGDQVSHTVFNPADAGDIAWGMTEAMLLNPPDEGNDKPFSEEIVAFVGSVVDSEGMINPPDVLRIGQIGRSVAEHIHNNFGDEPELGLSIWSVEQSKTDDINNLVKERLHLLFDQLESLELDNGDTKKIVRSMRSNLTSHLGLI